MAWRPGLRPVEKVDQETGVWDGMVERSGEKLPEVGEVRELAFGHPLAGQVGVDAVEA